jgi:hypothetical protein
MELPLMKFLKSFFCVVILLASACSSRLEIAGKEHALVFTKWQSLANYSGDTFTNEPISLVAKLKVVAGANGNEFILQEFQLTNQESAYQINLRNPEFENKLICDSECLFLTEYLDLKTINATMLARYYDKYEFDLFKLYSDIFTLKKYINEIKSVTPQGYEQYIDWILSTNVKFDDLTSLRQYLVNTFSVKGYTEFVQNPNFKLAHLLSRPENISDDVESLGFELDEYVSSEEAKLFSTEIDFVTQDMLNWVTDEAFTAGYLSENVGWLNNNLALETGTASIGDIVCVLGSNEFGQITEERGKLLTVNMLGEMSIVQDGVFTALTSDQEFRPDIAKSYTPIEGTKTYFDNQVTQCELR